MKCFYHTDMDGKCAGAIVRQYYMERGISGEYIMIDYRDDFPFDKIEKDETVVIVDFSIQDEGGFDRLREITSNIIWIDHHKTAIEKHAHLEDKIEGLRRDGTAGCVLTWEYFCPWAPLPKVVELLGDYDVWAFKFGEDTNKLQTGIRLYDTSVESTMWTDWLNPAYHPYTELRDGEIALQYRNNTYAGLVKGYSFPAIFEGYRIICCNAGSCSSQLFDSVDEATYDIMSSFVYDGKQWKVSLYTKKDNIDCSEIAKKYGGGGHRKAAGFQCHELPFRRSDI